MNDTEEIEIIEDVDEYADAMIDLGCGDDNVTIHQAPAV